MADTISKAMNEIMNMKNAGKSVCIINHASKLLINIFEIMKSNDYIDFKIDKTKTSKVTVTIKKLNLCKSIRPRFYVGINEIERYVRRYLPARDLGVILVSTNKGLITHDEIKDKKVGGCLIAYCY